MLYLAYFIILLINASEHEDGKHSTIMYKYFVYLVNQNNSDLLHLLRGDAF